jgi:hypothetical protein
MNYPATILVCLILFSSCRERQLFTLLPASQTGIHFNNKITETDSMNPMNHINIYNGGGVGIGDFNGDGLQDIYFTGNMVSNKLYLNKANLKFEDITEASRTGGKGVWCRGISVIDINNDSKDDIYVSVSMDEKGKNRKNLLYVNTGNAKNGIPVFDEQAAAYGLDDTTHTTMAHFFDADNDSDLDAYLVVNEHISADNPNRFRPIRSDGSHPSTGRLYRNDWNDTLKHGVFKNISTEAGITTEGYGHAAIITDINLDGWKDIYVTNDFLSANLLYINNHDGTFTNRSKDYFKQTSTFAMGVDMQDLNNDGLLDVVELDMNPKDNYRKKMMLGANSYQTMQNFDRYGYQYQYSKNSMQINQGPTVMQKDSIGPPVFSQVGFFSGIAETDWSWAPLVTDVDDDGYRDLVVTNGYPKDVTDHDFITYRDNASTVASTEDILRKIPEVKLKNYAFKNRGDLTFDDKTDAWGFEKASFSNGGAYADLDNDGDMELVINNINDEAHIYKNNKARPANSGNYFLNIGFIGDELNKGGFGTWVRVYYDSSKQQVYEHSPYRGYLSSVQSSAHFGLGKTPVVDSVVVIWPDAKRQVLRNVSANQLLLLKETDANLMYSFEKPAVAAYTLFKEISDSVGINFKYTEKDFIDFNIQKLLPHKFSEYSPALAVGDMDGNGFDDIVCSGTSASSPAIFFQQGNGSFLKTNLFPPIATAVSGGYGGTGTAFKDASLLLFDADGDTDLDLYAASGGYEHQENAEAYQDRLYINNGAGSYTHAPHALPQNHTSKACVRAADYDKDGDLDLFVAGRVAPWNYPKPVSSFIYRNDSKNGRVLFTDVTKDIANDLVNIGLVCDGLFTDFDNDGWIDVVLAGEWMAPTFLKNEQGVFKKLETTGVGQQLGWWNSLAPGDFDNDGDIDYMVGNAGLNTFFKGSEQHPLFITAKDFDENGSYDAFPSLFLPASQADTVLREYPAHVRDDVTKQVIGLRSRFLNYNAYATATMQDLFTREQWAGALRLKATTLASILLRNNGNGKFTATPLPLQAQISVLCGMTVDDFDADGNLDVVINGNDYGIDVSVGRSDALNGLYLKGDGVGNFSPLSILQSGIYIPGNGKAVVQLTNNKGNILLAANQHNGPLKLFALKRKIKTIPLLPYDAYVVVTYQNGRRQKRELYYGCSFLSQSGRFLTISGAVQSVQVTDFNGLERRITLP